jgi:hypothetical protein
MSGLFYLILVTRILEVRNVEKQIKILFNQSINMNIIEGSFKILDLSLFKIQAFIIILMTPHKLKVEFLK